MSKQIYNIANRGVRTPSIKETINEYIGLTIIGLIIGIMFFK